MKNELVHISKVGKSTDPIKLATSIILSIKSGEVVDVVSIGVNAINIANKALIVANNFAKETDLKLLFSPSFRQIVDNYGENRVSIVWRISTID